MNFLLWKEELVPDLDTAMARSRAGVQYLDGKFGPDWDRLIDLDTMHIMSPFSCILGQVNRKGRFCMPTPRRAVNCGFSCGIFLDLATVLFIRPRRLVRSFDLLTQAWATQIRWRREQRLRTAPASEEREFLAPDEAPKGLDPHG
jgi:hypothetical protein